MVVWILAGIVVYLLNLFVPSSLLIGRVGLIKPLGPRDDLPEPGALHARAIRARDNFSETFPIFLTLGVLSVVLSEANQSLALQGAQVAVLSRIVYMPAYMIGVPGLRTAVWGVWLLGLLMMGLALI